MFHVFCVFFLCPACFVYFQVFRKSSQLSLSKYNSGTFIWQDCINLLACERKYNCHCCIYLAYKVSQRVTAAGKSLCIPMLHVVASGCVYNKNIKLYLLERGFFIDVCKQRNYRYMGVSPIWQGVATVCVRNETLELPSSLFLVVQCQIQSI